MTDRTPGTTVATAVPCLAFQPITWSKADTDATIRQIKAHNAGILAICDGAALR